MKENGNQWYRINEKIPIILISGNVKITHTENNVFLGNSWDKEEIKMEITKIFGIEWQLKQ